MVERKLLANRELLADQREKDIAGRDRDPRLILGDVDTGEAGQLGKPFLREPQPLPDFANLDGSCDIFHSEVPVTHKPRACQVQKGGSGYL